MNWQWILAVGVLGSVSGTVSAAPEARCVSKTGVAGTFERTMTSGGWARTYLLHVPESYDGTTPVPLVLNFHGLLKSGAYQQDYTGMSEKADDEGFIVAYPDGIESSWNAGFCCPPATSLGLDDVGFAKDLVAALSEEYCIDPGRVYATGSSNGGMLSHRLGCEASDVFAAIAPASAYIAVDDCAPDRPVPVIQSQGTADPIVPYWTAKASNEFWAANNQCLASGPVYHKGGATCYAYEGCAQDATVEFCEVKGMGHTWPSDDGPVDWLDDTDMFWSFFEAHPMGD